MKNENTTSMYCLPVVSVPVRAIECRLALDVSQLEILKRHKTTATRSLHAEGYCGRGDCGTGFRNSQQYKLVTLTATALGFWA